MSATESPPTVSQVPSCMECTHWKRYAKQPPAEGWLDEGEPTTGWCSHHKMTTGQFEECSNFHPQTMSEQTSP